MYLPYFFNLCCLRRSFIHSLLMSCCRLFRTLQFDRESVENSARLVPSISEKKSVSMVRLSFFSSGFSHLLGLPEWLLISFFQFFLSCASSSFNPTLFYTSLSTWLSVFLSASFLVLVHLTFFLARPLCPFF